MTLEEIKALADIDALESQVAELRGIDIDSLSAEECEDVSAKIDAIQERKKELLEEAKKKQEERSKIANGQVQFRKIEKPLEGDKKMEKINTKSPEYRSAFYAMLQGRATSEQRALLNIDGSTDGSVAATTIALPHTLDERIWDNVHEAHPILNDIVTIHSGIVMDVNKLTAVSPRAASKKDGDATPELGVTIIPVTLAGKDYPVSIPMSYAMDAMNPNGLEEMLGQFIADEIGEALANDVVARMISDAGTSRKVDLGSTPDYFDKTKEALSLVKASNKVVYAGAKFYDLLGYRGTDGHAENIAATLQCTIKYEPSCGNNIVVVDPKAFVLNEAVALMVEREKSVKDHKVYAGGFLRAEGTMRDQRKVAYIA